MLERMRQQNKPVTPQMEQLAAWMDGMDTEGADGMVRLYCPPQGYLRLTKSMILSCGCQQRCSARCACHMSLLLAWLALTKVQAAQFLPWAAEDSRVVDV